MFFPLLVLFVLVLVGLAFLTLLERKVLGYVQVRKGPNKVGYAGILQPFGDAIKLFSKEQTFPLVSNFFSYYLCPLFSLMVSLFIWSMMPFYSGLFSFNLSMLFFLCVSSLGVYMVIVSGWASNSCYSLLGGLRAAAQTISYEVSMSLIIISLFFLVADLGVFTFLYYQLYAWFICLCLPLGLMLMVSMLAETNRTPFDFAEGESELVSGFNVEYSSGGFALIFMAEYSSILFMSMMFSMLFLGGSLYSVFFFLKLVFISFFWVWVRGTLPRHRYDKLMYLAWKGYLIYSLSLIMFFYGACQWAGVLAF
uniref:NADH-ubiquinone oxidoreductase chain 1 n=1 Tax=Melittomma sp. MEL01 TaxID=1205634 RepID=A0A0S2MPN8_9CUCU|nr:NADH deshydrogenase subunit 1 [Melittomma sp. MEL01]